MQTDEEMNGTIILAESTRGVKAVGVVVPDWLILSDYSRQQEQRQDCRDSDAGSRHNL